MTDIRIANSAEMDALNRRYVELETAADQTLTRAGALIAVEILMKATQNAIFTVTEERAPLDDLGYLFVATIKTILAFNEVPSPVVKFFADHNIEA